MSEFTRVCKVSDVPDPGQMVVEVGDRLVALFHVEGKFWAIDDLCTHDGGPLDQGELTGDVLECPRHGARFDVRTGKVLALPAVKPLNTYLLRVEGSEIRVALP